MRLLVTGTAGFIGFHLAGRLLAEGHRVTGLDALTPYYDVRLKAARHARLEAMGGFTAHVHPLEDMQALERTADAAEPEVIVHLAAQAGVRYSLEHPRGYVETNAVGTFNVLEIARRFAPRHLLMASTSSVYGANAKMPFEETDRTDHPLTIYAATKKAAEDMAHSYAHLWRIPTTALRFFTVYGPWGRPDMALFRFVDAGLAGEPVEVFNGGRMRRDFTYVEDVVESVVRLIGCVPVQGSPVAEFDSLSPAAPYRCVNVGGGTGVELGDFVDAVERGLGVTLRREMREMQKGDVPATLASPRLLQRLTGFTPATPLAEGVGAFIDWYRDYHAA